MAAALLVAGCGGAAAGDADATGPITPKTPTVAKVILTPASATLVVGDSVVFTVAPLDADGVTVSGKSATWTSDASGVAAIAASEATKATVRAGDTGTAHITATIDGKSATSSITVNPAKAAAVPVAAVQMNPVGLELEVDRTWQIWATPVDAQGNPLAGRSVTWHSSDPEVASVSDHGLVTAHKAGGPLTVSATSEGKVGKTTVTVTDPTTVTYASLALGKRHTCALSKDGTAYCWGEIALDPVDEPHGASLRPVPVAGGHRFVALAAGTMLTCGLDTAGIAYCWGLNPAGGLGDGTTDLSAAPVLVAGGLKFSTLSTRSSTSCGLTSAGSAYCWGSNHSGQMGTGSEADEVATPARAMLGLALARLSTGDAYACGIDENGEGYCAGYNFYGQLGDGTNTDKPSPVKIAGGLRFRSLDAGSGYTCAITENDGAYCWGSAQRGVPDTGDRNTPTKVPGGSDFTSIAVGGDHTCALTAAGAAYCWGMNSSGQLGNGTWSGDGSLGLQTTPAPVAGGLTFVSIGVGDMHTCGITVAGRLYCWGENEWGQLGDGTTIDRNRPILVGNPTTP